MVSDDDDLSVDETSGENVEDKVEAKYEILTECVILFLQFFNAKQNIT